MPTSARHPNLHVTVGPCSLGIVLVAASQDGVAAILFGDDRDHVMQDLRSQFPDAEFVVGDQRSDTAFQDMKNWIDDPTRAHNFPLHLSGTDFQRRVWQALLEIPPGTTTTYRRVAESIGLPSATRAVAAACAANKIAIAIPCHRVVRHDGSLSGYRWGIARKQQLLERESAATAAGQPRRAKAYAQA